MSDAVVFGILTLATLVAKGILDEVRARRMFRENQELKEGLQINTDATITGAQAVKEYDSATRHVGEQAANAATTAAKVAATVALDNVLANQQVLARTKDIAKGQEQIKEQLNGGPDGFGSRIAKNEARLEGLEKGQADNREQVDFVRQGLVAVAKSVDMMTLNFSSFVELYNKNHQNGK